MTAEKIVATGHNPNYIFPWMVMTRSFAMSSKDVRKMIVGNLNGSFNEEDRLFMRNYADFLGITLEIMDLKMPADLESHHGRTSVNYLPLLFLDSLEENFVWLDSDLILEPGWEEIFETKYSKEGSRNVVICAAPDRHFTRELLKKNNTNEAYLKNSMNYFNSGVMLLSPKVWRSLKFNEVWQGVSRKRPELKMDFNDQDVLNYLLHNSVEILPGKFNYIPGDIHLSAPLITHFAGYPKPWRMTSKSRAMYFMREAINWDRPQFRPSREGKFKSEYLDYWRHEDDMLNDLKDNSPGLFEEALSRKKAITVDLNLQEKVKYALARCISVEFQNLLFRNRPKLTGFQKELWGG